MSETASPGDRKGLKLVPLFSGTLTAGFADSVTVDTFNVVAYGRVGPRLDVVFNGVVDVEIEAQSSADMKEWWPMSRTIQLTPASPDRVQPELFEIRSKDWPATAKVPLPDLDVSTVRFVRFRMRGAGAVVTLRAAVGR